MSTEDHPAKKMRMEAKVSSGPVLLKSIEVDAVAPFSGDWDPQWNLPLR